MSKLLELLKKAQTVYITFTNSQDYVVLLEEPNLESHAISNQDGQEGTVRVKRSPIPAEEDDDDFSDNSDDVTLDDGFDD
jgi:hypothetical protein